MRKLIYLVMVIAAFMSVCFVSTVRAEGYPDYLWGNKNFILCGAHMGDACYVDKSSLVVEEYNPPVYKLAVKVVNVPDADRGNVTPSSTHVCHIFYDWNERKMYELGHDGKWRYIHPVGPMAKTGHYFVGEMAFYIAYKMKFYGGREWYDEDTGRLQYPNWSDSLYTLVDKAR